MNGFDLRNLIAKQHNKGERKIGQLICEIKWFV